MAEQVGQYDIGVGEALNSLSEVKQAIKDAQKETQRLERDNKSLAGSIAKLGPVAQEALGELKKQLEDNKKSIIEQNDIVEKGTQILKGGTEQTVESTKATKKDSKAKFANTKSLAALNTATGGLTGKIQGVVMSFTAARTATIGFTAALSQAQKALLATGVGAIVVALGLIIAYWEEIISFIQGTNLELIKQNELLIKEQKELTQISKVLEAQKKTLELEGKNLLEINKQIKQQLELQIEKQIALVKNLQLQLQQEEANNREVTFIEAAKIGFAAIFNIKDLGNQVTKAGNKESKFSLELIELLSNAQVELQTLKQSSLSIDKESKDTAQAILDIETKRIELANKNFEKALNERLKFEDEFNKETALSQKEKDALEIQSVKDKYAKLQEEAFVNAESFEELAFLIEELDNARDERILQKKEDFRLRDENIALKNAQEIQKIANLKAKSIIGAELSEMQIREIGYKQMQAGIGILKSVAGENKTLQAGILLAEAAVNIARTITTTQAANAIIVAEGAALAIPTAGASVATAAKLVTANNLSAGFSIAQQVAATATGLSSLGKGGSPSGSAPTSGPQIQNAEVEPIQPTFNTVGANDTNQLANAIGSQSQQPIQTFVVANDVTTAQGLQRNIIDGATI